MLDESLASELIAVPKSDPLMLAVGHICNVVPFSEASNLCPVALGSSLEAVKWELRLQDSAGMVSPA